MHRLGCMWLKRGRRGEGCKSWNDMVEVATEATLVQKRWDKARESLVHDHEFPEKA